MLQKLGIRFTQLFIRFMPNAFVFALLLTLLTSAVAILWTGSSPLEVIQGWYKGFFDLIGFAMQIVLLIITGYSIALSPTGSKSNRQTCPLHQDSYQGLLCCSLGRPAVVYGQFWMDRDYLCPRKRISPQSQRHPLSLPDCLRLFLI